MNGVNNHTVFFVLGGTMCTIRLLTAEQVAKILGISRSKAYLMMGLKEIPTITIGKNVRVSMEDLEDFIKTHKTNYGEVHEEK
jgi:excisionase family DNA binding protein